MHKALRGESPEQSLHNAVLQMQVNDFVSHRAGIFKYHGANRRNTTPFPWLLIAGTRNTEGVHRIGPGGIGSLSLVERRKVATRRAGLGFWIRNRLARLRSDQFARGRKARREGCRDH